MSELAFFLALRGHQVAIVTSRQLYQDAGAGLAARERVKGVEVLRVATTRFGRAKLVGRALDYVSFYLGAAFALWGLARPGVTVVAKTDPPLISVVAGIVCRMRGAVLVNWLQDVFPEIAAAAGSGLARGWLGQALVRQRNRSLLRAAMNVALGERMASRLKEVSAGAAKVCVIPNWVDGRSILPASRDNNPLRPEWGLAGKFVVAYSGNMGRVHEFETILGAALRLRESPDIRFVFIGDGRWRNWIEAKVQQHGLGNVLLRPYQATQLLTLSLGVGDVHLVSLQPQMEGLVVPSKFYGIAAAGRPSVFIGDPEGEIAVILAKHHIGSSVRPGDVDGLVAALLDLKDNPERRLAMGARARSVFEAEFDKPIAMARWEAVLRASADAHEPAGPS